MPDNEKKRKRAVVLAESKPTDKGRDESFATEGNNLKEFYAKNFPDTDVEVIPFYGKDEFEAVKERLKGVEDVFLFGHSGGMLGGVEHTDIANSLKESGVVNCYSGSCSFEKYAEPYKSLPNFYYRPEGSWYGLKKNANNLIEAMFSKAYTGNPNDYYGAGVVDPKLGEHYNATKGRTTETPIEFKKEDLIRYKPLASFFR